MKNNATFTFLLGSLLLYTISAGLIYLLLVLASCGNDIANTSNSNNPIDNSDNSNQNNDNSIREELPTTLPPTDVFTSCTPPNSILDNNFLWKPISDSNGNLVVLFDEKYGIKFDKVVATRQDGLTEELTFADFANGNRQHWRGDSPGVDYTGELTVIQNSDVCVGIIPIPGERYEGE